MRGFQRAHSRPQHVEQAPGRSNMKIEQFPDPYLNVPWETLGARVLSSGQQVAVTLGYPAAGMAADLAASLARYLGVEHVDLDLRFRPPEGRGAAAPGRIRHIIAVASGKGGVGKSTTAVNLALALEKEGARVGLLDADIYGPSQGMMLGVAEGRRPEVKDEKFFLPIKAHGIQAMSMSFLITEETPMVWRGPMVSNALQQLLGQNALGAMVRFYFEHKDQEDRNRVLDHRL